MLSPIIVANFKKNVALSSSQEFREKKLLVDLFLLSYDDFASFQSSSSPAYQPDSILHFSPAAATPKKMNHDPACKKASSSKKKKQLPPLQATTRMVSSSSFSFLFNFLVLTLIATSIPQHSNNDKVCDFLFNFY